MRNLGYIALLLMVPFLSATAQAPMQRVPFMQVDVEIKDAFVPAFVRKLQACGQKEGEGGGFAVRADYSGAPSRQVIQIKWYRGDLEVVGIRSEPDHVFHFSLYNWTMVPCCPSNGTFFGWVRERLIGTPSDDFMDGLKEAVEGIPEARIDIVKNNGQPMTGRYENAWMTCLELHMDDKSIPEFLKRLRAFADEHGFASAFFRVSDGIPNLIDIYRDDLEVQISISRVQHVPVELTTFKGADTEHSGAASAAFVKGVRQIIAGIPGGSLQEKTASKRSVPVLPN